ncbi:hypothetical protein [Numidum massiliense]|uniref:hypothetical protein n=1 Tax=Numidum massiliense TaxID=1522315 RepID=UPI0006D57BE2|nr:hypothetical protein [Numidum massiliense]
MKIKLSKAQYIKLIEVVYLGNWLANSSRGAHETIEVYEQNQQHIFSYAKQFDVGDDVLQQHGTKYYASLEVEERLGTLVDEYESKAFWGNLASKLSFRDLFREIGPLNRLTDETMQRELIDEEWYEETMALFINWIADGLVVEK